MKPVPTVAAPAPAPIFTFGYSKRRFARFLAIVEERNAIVVDIRLLPRSKYAEWDGDALIPGLKGRYWWCRALGNKNRFVGGPMELVNWEDGLRQVRGLLKAHPGQPLILMCGCRAESECHRALVAKFLRAEGYKVEELSWPRRVASWRREQKVMEL